MVLRIPFVSGAVHSLLGSQECNAADGNVLPSKQKASLPADDTGMWRKRNVPP